MESFEDTIGTTALFLFKFFEIFLRSSIEKFGLAASCMKTLLGLYLFKYFRALKEESDLFFPPLIIRICFDNFFFSMNI